MVNKIVIKILSGGEVGKTYEFIKSEVSIGSSDKDDIQFDYLSGLQPNHATLTIEDGKVIFKNNCFSSVYINKKARDKEELTFDDEIQFGMIGPKIQLINPENTVKKEEDIKGIQTTVEKVSSDFEVHKIALPEPLPIVNEDIQQEIQENTFENVSLKQNIDTPVAIEPDEFNHMAVFEEFEITYKKTEQIKELENEGSFQPEEIKPDSEPELLQQAQQHEPELSLENDEHSYSQAESIEPSHEKVQKTLPVDLQTFHQVDAVRPVSIKEEFHKASGQDITSQWLEKGDYEVIDSEKPDANEPHNHEPIIEMPEQEYVIPDHHVISEFVIKKEDFNLGAAGSLTIETIEQTIIQDGLTHKKKKYVLKENGKIVKECSKPIDTASLIKKAIRSTTSKENPYRIEKKSIEAKVDRSVDSYSTISSRRHKKSNYQSGKPQEKKAYSNKSEKVLRTSSHLQEASGFSYYEHAYKTGFQYIVNNLINEIDKLLIGSSKPSGYKAFEKIAREKQAQPDKEIKPQKRPLTSIEATNEEIRLARAKTISCIITGIIFSVLLYGFFSLFSCIGFVAKLLVPIGVSAFSVLALNTGQARLPEREFYSVFTATVIILFNSLIVNGLYLFFTLFNPAKMNEVCASVIIFGTLGFLLKLVISVYFAAKIAHSEEPERD